MYTDFNFFQLQVTTKNVCRIKEKLLLPPHLNSATTLCSKTQHGSHRTPYASYMHITQWSNYSIIYEGAGKYGER